MDAGGPAVPVSGGFVDFELLRNRAGSVEGARVLFEDLVAQLVGIDHPEAQNVRAAPGDWGIDAIVGDLDGGHVAVWQAKYFVGGVGRVQRAQVLQSLQSLEKASEQFGFHVDAWTLCLPADLDPAGLKWWHALAGAQRKSGRTLELWGRTQLSMRLFRPAASALRETFFPVLGAPLTSRVEGRLGRRLCSPPPPHARLVGRTDEMRRCVELVLRSAADDAPVLVSTALDGPGGIGKTLVAQHVCALDEVQSSFPDGCFWLTLGQEPDLVAASLDLLAALTGSRPPSAHLDMLGGRLAEVVRGRRLLVVLDDVWSEHHLAPFLASLAGCSILITSRRPDICPGATAVPLGHLGDAAAQTLLLEGIDAVDSSAAVRRLGRRLGNWPLLLDLANRQLRRRVRYGQRALDAIADLEAQLAQRGPTSFDLLTARDSDQRRAAFAATMEAGMSMLSDASRELLWDIAAFREDAHLGLRVLGGLGEVPSDQLRTHLLDLADLRLVELDLGADDVHLHDVIREFLAHTDAGSSARQQRIATSLYQMARDGDPVACRELPHQLRQADASHLLSQLTSPWWIARLTDATGDVTAAMEAQRQVVATTAADDPLAGRSLIATHALATIADLAHTMTEAELRVAVARHGIASASLSAQRLHTAAERARAFAHLTGMVDDENARRRLADAAMAAILPFDEVTVAGLTAVVTTAEALARAGASSEAIEVIAATVPDEPRGDVPPWAWAMWSGRAAQVLARVGDVDRAERHLHAGISVASRADASRQQLDAAGVELLAAASLLVGPGSIPASCRPRSESYRRQLRRRLVEVGMAGSAAETAEHLSRWAAECGVGEPEIRALQEAEAPSADLLFEIAVIGGLLGRPPSGTDVEPPEGSVAGRVASAARACIEQGCELPQRSIDTLVRSLLVVGETARAEEVVAVRRDLARRRRQVYVGRRTSTDGALAPVLGRRAARDIPDRVIQLAVRLPHPQSIGAVVLTDFEDRLIRTPQAMEMCDARALRALVEGAIGRGDLSTLRAVARTERDLPRVVALAEAALAVVSDDSRACLRLAQAGGLPPAIADRVLTTALRADDVVSASRIVLARSPGDAVALLAVRAVGRRHGPEAAIDVLVTATPSTLLANVVERIGPHLGSPYLSALVGAVTGGSDPEIRHALLVSLLDVVARHPAGERVWPRLVAPLRDARDHLDSAIVRHLRDDYVHAARVAGGIDLDAVGPGDGPASLGRARRLDERVRHDAFEDAWRALDADRQAAVIDGWLDVVGRPAVRNDPPGRSGAVALPAERWLAGLADGPIPIDLRHRAEVGPSRDLVGPGLALVGAAEARSFGQLDDDLDPELHAAPLRLVVPGGQLHHGPDGRAGSSVDPAEATRALFSDLVAGRPSDPARTGSARWSVRRVAAQLVEEGLVSRPRAEWMRELARRVREASRLATAGEVGEAAMRLLDAGATAWAVELITAAVADAATVAHDGIRAQLVGAAAYPLAGRPDLMDPGLLRMLLDEAGHSGLSFDALAVILYQRAVVHRSTDEAFSMVASMVETERYLESI